MSLPDLLGYRLDEAEARLRAAGVPVRVEEAAPPRGRPAGPRRVVRQRLEGEVLVLTVAAERVEAGA
ncbi:MAG: PASTA domain-containing protein [Armatimonadota bacterium]|nr:PASTA domain-containing protein [Armatimonadota bacterium]MDR7449319.1 PASTA domain-containing protein [Armatimonadota bacterium]MDR7458766.1 PASTA domain-containing protein [Armatimonadota bacterium]MDR7479984.1 PASTA domain-containing protein [Armatimonadota bacterium]MDR7488626.1 PASTA domain-containing protein [Armatimonadota bacterium]